MPYTAEHKQETRTRIIKSARRLFNRNGFANVSIDEIMSEAGLTHGGFYKHFSAKDDLYEVGGAAVHLRRPAGTLADAAHRSRRPVALRWRR